MQNQPLNFVGVISYSDYFDFKQSSIFLNIGFRTDREVKFRDFSYLLSSDLPSLNFKHVAQNQ